MASDGRDAESSGAAARTFLRRFQVLVGLVLICVALVDYAVAGPPLWLTVVSLAVCLVVVLGSIEILGRRVDR